MKYSLGGWVNESVPDISDYLEGLNIDCDEFTQWLGVLVGRYRFEQEHRFPNASTEKKELDEYIKTLEKMIGYSFYGGLPPVVQSEFNYRALKAGINAIEFQESLRKNLTYALVIAKGVQAKARRWKSPRGAPKQTTRDQLVAAVVERLKPHCQNLTDARCRTEDILQACGIEVTRAADPQDAERAVRRLEKRAKGTGNQKK